MPGGHAGPDHAGPDHAGPRDWNRGRLTPADSRLERGRPAYLWNRRIQACYDVTLGCALAAAAFTILGSASALSRMTSLAAIAQSATHAIKPGLLNLIGPIIVLLALPAHRGGLRAATGQPDQPGQTVLVEAISPRMLVRRGLRWNLAGDVNSADVVRFSYRGAYLARALLTTAAWIAALGLLIFSLTSLGDGYTVTSGTFLLGMLEMAGLIAALAMRPAGLPRARVIGQPTQRSSWASRAGTR